jgi:hypothetical protein
MKAENKGPWNQARAPKPLGKEDGLGLGRLAHLSCVGHRLGIGAGEAAVTEGASFAEGTLESQPDSLFTSIRFSC